MIDSTAPRSRELRVTGVSRAFAGVRALTDVSLAVEPGQVLGLIGPNGAGKSTLVNIISGYDLPDSGTVTLDGRDITRTKPYVRARGALARTFQHGHLFNGLSVRENIIVTAMGTGQKRKQAIATAHELIADFGLESRAYDEFSSFLHCFVVILFVV
jgi:branched-chain amino acid transport system ATP-binding protein